MKKIILALAIVSLVACQKKSDGDGGGGNLRPSSIPDSISLEPMPGPALTQEQEKKFEDFFLYNGTLDKTFELERYAPAENIATDQRQRIENEISFLTGEKKYWAQTIYQFCVNSEKTLSKIPDNLPPISAGQQYSDEYETLVAGANCPFVKKFRSKITLSITEVGNGTVKTARDSQLSLQLKINSNELIKFTKIKELNIDRVFAGISIGTEGNNNQYDKSTGSLSVMLENNEAVNATITSSRLSKETGNNLNDKNSVTYKSSDRVDLKTNINQTEYSLTLTNNYYSKGQEPSIGSGNYYLNGKEDKQKRPLLGYINNYLSALQ